MQAIFKQEFNVKTLIEGGVVFEHFMPHTSKKGEIIQSLNKHTKSLIWNMLSMTESFMGHFEPINLIADYYGEKYAMYLAFFLHHVGWLLIPAFFGTILFIVHLVVAFKFQEDDQSYILSYLNNIDTPVNYLYILFVALWSTFYVESWKRKQATIQYIWGLKEKEEQIKKSVKLPQENTEFIYDEQQGKVIEVVMNDNKCAIGCTNVIILLLFSSLAIVASVATILMKDVIDFDEDEKNKKDYWLVFTVFLNSICVAILTKFFTSIVEHIVKRENHGEDADYENSMITKSFIMSSIISFGGLMLLAFWERSFYLLNLLMIFLILFKQILLNLIEAGLP